MMWTLKRILCLLAILSMSTGFSAVAEEERYFDYRYATKEEGIELMLGNDAYYDGFTQNDLDYRMQKTGTTMEEYQAFASAQILDFTEDEKTALDACMSKIERNLKEKGYVLPDLDQIVFIRATMAEECNALAYTHGTQIYLNEDMFPPADAEEISDVYIEYLWHELFHCLTRCSPDFRAEMYKLIHFTIVEEDYVLPDSLTEYFISNPDVEHHNAYATFMIYGKAIDCYAAFATSRHFENPGDSFFSSGRTVLVPIDGTDVYYTADQCSNFNEIFGTNTDCVIDPEECMADNFSFAMTYGLEGRAYSNPEIISGILGYVAAGQSPAQR